MKLSSVPLIAAALAAIAGSVIAVPGSLHARALEKVNSFTERDVDVYSRESGLALLEREVDGGFVDDLFTRMNAEEHKIPLPEGSDLAATARKAAALARSGTATTETRISQKAAWVAEKAKEAAEKAKLIVDHAKARHDDHEYKFYLERAKIYAKEARRQTKAAKDYGWQASVHGNDAMKHDGMERKHRQDAEAIRNHKEDGTQMERAKGWRTSVRVANDSIAQAAHDNEALRGIEDHYDQTNAEYDLVNYQHDRHPAVAYHLHDLAHQGSHGR